MGIILIRAINWFAQILITLMMMRAIMSWFVKGSSSNFVGRLYRTTIVLTEPVVEPCRKFMARFNTGMIDFSLLIAFFMVEITARILTILIAVVL